MIRAGILISLFLFSSALRPAPTSDPIEQQIWLSHCDGSGWYVSTEDADSVTVRCDPKPDDSGDQDQPADEDANAPVHLDSI